MTSESPEQRPLLRVVRGTPDDVELAALTAVVAALAAAAAAAQEEAQRQPWSHRQAMVRRALSHGPGAWRASGMPG